ncbi:glycoside hydrolase family 3 C-terminal domain-containing protein [Actinosynnema pretiosum subsp. pretiosum]|uniref:beta-N-acetylhexosaminidase n=1 Tax=Actinosynnema pretiosum subsp. pretiosum TaxID=103721 RepID=A0AA45R1Q5_9PSEU|nr:Beta-hexosaminidase [Actinosynnema pretiosum subsp. pretiosum]QUF01680.1 glycoside hydrolase family 3 C-terminal domain-containing protein [Actinosynnema pretiosum subsp. pretiosum]
MHRLSRTLLTAAVVASSTAALPSAHAARPEPPAPQSVTSLVRGMSLEEKVGQLFVTYVHGQSADEVHPGNLRDFGVDTPAQVVTRYRPGGVIYFNNSSYDNIDTPAQIAALSNGLQQASRVPLTISTDQEMGIVTRIGPPLTQFPGSMALGAGRDERAAERAASVTARELRALGITQNFAPDADVNSNPANPVIGVRSFSSDPDLAATMVAAQVRGYQQRHLSRTAVSAAAKHFPGHGDTADDSHTSLPTVDRTVEQWREVDAKPFRAAIAAGVDSIMTAHIRMPAIDPSGEPATLSKPVVTGLLREELGYDGVVITDSLAMAGVRQLHTDAEIPVLALKAGVDQLLMPVKLGEAIDAVVAAVRAGELSERRIDQSVLRVLRMKFLRGALPVWPVPPNPVVGTPDRLAQAQEVADRAVTVVRDDAGVVRAGRVSGPVLVTGWGETTTAALAERLRARGATPQVVVTGSAPNEQQIAGAVSAAGGVGAVVVLTNALSRQPAQRALVDRLVASGKPVVAVAVQNPYDVAHSNAQAWLATYSYGAVAMESVARVLSGEVRPVGRLPVDVPGPVAYPLGHGLSW